MALYKNGEILKLREGEEVAAEGQVTVPSNLADYETIVMGIIGEKLPNIILEWIVGSINEVYVLVLSEVFPPKDADLKSIRDLIQERTGVDKGITVETLEGHRAA